MEAGTVSADTCIALASFQAYEVNIAFSDHFGQNTMATSRINLISRDIDRAFARPARLVTLPLSC